MCYNINMFLVGIFQWWYGNGLLQYIRQSFLGVLRTADFFSVGLLLKTLFNPFRQISAAPVGGDLSVQLSAKYTDDFSNKHSVSYPTTADWGFPPFGGTEGGLGC